MLEARRPWPGVWPCPDTLQSEPPNEFISSLGLSCPGVQPSSALTDSKSAGDSLPPQDCSPGALGAGRPRPSLAPLPDSCRPLITAAAVTLIAFTHLLGKHIVNMGGAVLGQGPPSMWSPHCPQRTSTFLQTLSYVWNMQRAQNINMVIARRCAQEQ